LYFAGVSGLAGAAALCAALSAAPARGALAKQNGGSGYSANLSSSATIRQQQLICDPTDPTMGTASVQYNPNLVTLAGLSTSNFQYGPGYGQTPGQPIARVEYRLSAFAFFQDVNSFPFTLPSGGVETGYVQVMYTKIGQTGRLSTAGPGGNFIQTARDPGVTGTTGVDTFALIFQAASTSIPLTSITSYTVFGADRGTHGTGFGTDPGNAGDFMTGLADDNVTTFRVPINATTSPSNANDPANYIAPATVSGNFIPEPSAAAVLGIAGAGLLLRRRRSVA